MKVLTNWLDPPWIPNLNAEDLEELQRRADLTLAQRQLAVGAAYVAFFTAFAFLTPYGSERPIQAILLGVALVAVSLFRLWNARQIVERKAANCLRQRRMYRLGCYGVALVWACFTYDGLVAYGQSSVGFVVLIGIAGLTNGATSSLCMDLRLALVYMCIMMAPVFIWAAMPGPGSLMISTMAAIYLIFLAGLSRRQNFAVLSGFRDNMRLEVQARELLRAKELAESAAVARSRFLAAMSHEIRTPLSGVLGLLNLLAETCLNTQQQELTRSIQHSGDMLLTIVNDILDYSKINAGKLALEDVAFELRPVLTGLIEPLRRLANQRGLLLDYHISSSVPEWIQGDPTRLKQVLNNLVSNAIKFTSAGRIQVLVHIHEGALRFSVRDTGIGIAAEAIPRLFDEFSQADQSTTRRFGGTGLGLAICHKLVDAMGGSIAVESQPGQGSLFWFDIPLRPATPAARAAVISQRVISRPLRILVAEDNPVNQRIIQHAVEKIGHTATLVSNGAEAVDLFQSQAFDLILMDCQMPVMDGFEASRRIRASNPRGAVIPIIAVTANAFTEDREQCLAAGMSDHVGKPVQPRLLHSAIERCMSILEECGRPQAVAEELSSQNSAPSWPPQTSTPREAFLAGAIRVPAAPGSASAD